MTNEMQILAKVAELNFMLEGQAKEEYSPVLKEVLNMLKEKDEQIEGQKCVIETQTNNEEVLLKQLEKKDRQIDLMAEFIATLDIEEDICANIEKNNCDKMAFGECENCIKQYFERKSEK